MIDWTQPVCTSHETPFIGLVMEDCPVHGRKRVVTISPYLLRDPHFQPSDKAATTTWRLNDDGSSQSDKPSDFDFVNYDPEDGAVRITLEGAKITCRRRAA